MTQHIPSREQWEAAILNLRIVAHEAVMGLCTDDFVALERVHEKFLKAIVAFGYRVAAMPQGDLVKRPSDEIYDISESPAEIFLEPQCAEEAYEGRSWSIDDRGPCEDCNSPCVKYVRADRIEALEAAASQPSEREAATKEALKLFLSAAVILTDIPDDSDKAMAEVMIIKAYKLGRKALAAYAPPAITSSPDVSEAKS